MGHYVPVANTARTVLELIAAETCYLSTADWFIREIYEHLGLLEAAKNMFASTNAGLLFSDPAHNGQECETPLGFLAHKAIVVTTMCELLRLRMNRGVGPEPGAHSQRQ